MSTLRRSMIGSDAEPQSVQWSAAASVVSGDVMQMAKLMVLLIMLITLTAWGLYRNRCRPRAVQSQPPSSSTNNSTPPLTEAMGIPGAMEILNSIEASLENVQTSVVSSDNDDTVVPDSTNMVVLEMASLALPA